MNCIQLLLLKLQYRKTNIKTIYQAGYIITSQFEMEFKEFEPRFKSAKPRFELSAGINLETFDTILSGTNLI